MKDPLLGFFMEPLLPIGIHLPERGTRTLLQDLHRQLRSAIVEGRLRPGLRLPSTRSIAQTYGVSRNTAVAAYDLLLSEGYILARRGSRTEVAASLPKAPSAPAIRRAPTICRIRMSCLFGFCRNGLQL